jgi:hypothetical protein
MPFLQQLRIAGRLARTIRTIFVLICSSIIFVSCTSARVQIHPHHSEARIRNTILQYTPIGSSRDSVLNFINNRLHHDGSPLTNSTSIDDLNVGWYWTEFPLVPMITYVYASWSFDNQDRLINITVVKDIDAP